MRWLDLLQSGAVAKSYTSFTVGASQLFGPAKQTLAKTAAYDRNKPEMLVAARFTAGGKLHRLVVQSKRTKGAMGRKSDNKWYRSSPSPGVA